MESWEAINIPFEDPAHLSSQQLKPDFKLGSSPPLTVTCLQGRLIQIAFLYLPTQLLNIPITISWSQYGKTNLQ
jgi:hypothetical protein